jgi:HK97 family phage major capsid protein
MNENIKALIAEAEEKRKEIESILSGKEQTAEQIQRATELDTRIDEIKEHIQASRKLSEKAAEYDRWLNQPTNPLPHEGAAKVLGEGTPSGNVGIDHEGNPFYIDGEPLMDEKKIALIQSKEYGAEWNRYIRSKGAIVGKALAEGADDSGGFLTPEAVLAELIQKKPTPSRLGDMVRTIPTSRDSLTVARVKYTTDDIYTTGIRVQPTGEVPASATASRVNFPDSTGGNQFGALRFQVYTQMMTLPVSNDMLEDAVFPINSWISDMFRQTVMLYKENMILNGLGGAQPQGILLNPNGADQPATVAMGNPITADGVLDVGLELPEQYEDNAGYIFNKTSTFRSIRKLKDSEGRYLFGTGMQDSGMAQGRTKEIGGYPYTFCAFAPSLGANNYPVIFGDPQAYYWIQRVDLSIQILREIQAQTNQTVVLARLRVGGGVAQPWMLKIGQQA